MRDFQMKIKDLALATANNSTKLVMTLSFCFGMLSALAPTQGFARPQKNHYAGLNMPAQKQRILRCNAVENHFVSDLPKHRKLRVDVMGSHVTINHSRVFYRGQNPYTGYYEYSRSAHGPVGISISEDVFVGSSRGLSGSQKNLREGYFTSVHIKSKKVGYWIYSCA